MPTFPKDVQLVHVTEADDLTALLDRADNEPLVLERDGVRYVLNREDVGAYYDPEAVREALRSLRSAPLLSDEAADRIRQELERRRERSEHPVAS